MTMIGQEKEYGKLSDDQLMKAIIKRDEEAFRELYDRYARHLLNFLLRMMNNDQEKARDFLQEVFMRVIRSADRYEPGRSVKTWLYTITLNLCKNEYRRLSIRRNHEDGANTEAPSYTEIPAEHMLDLDIFYKALDSELNKLPIHLRSTFILRFKVDLSIREIADVMGCSQGTVKSRLFYLLRNLADNLKSFNPYSIEAN
jgi:RNA polymerase sigma-70 factor (ECF subfamily)